MFAFFSTLQGASMQNDYIAKLSGIYAIFVIDFMEFWKHIHKQYSYYR